MSPTTLGLPCVGAAVASLALLAPPPRAAELPYRLGRAVDQVVKPTAEERQQLLSGGPFTKLLASDASREVAVFGSIWIAAPHQLYAKALQDIEDFERGGGFTLTRRISDPPRLEDFAGLRLSKDDLEDLRNCRVGKCELKLGADALTTIRSEVDWSKPGAGATAEAVLRRILFEYVTRYQKGGNKALAVYRDKSEPRFVENEFRSMIDRMPALATGMPALHDYLVDYPKASWPGVIDIFYWQETEFGLKPTTRVSHLVIHSTAERTVVASKMLYASHYFWTALELRVLVPDAARGNGFWFMTVNRSRSDGLSGFTGTFVRRRVRSEVADGTLAALTATKAAIEARAR
jgi:hypothetical protein